MSFIILLYIILKFYVFNYNEIKIRKNIKINLFKFQKTKNSILHFKKEKIFLHLSNVFVKSEDNETS
jgi:hypothetical protein